MLVGRDGSPDLPRTDTLAQDIFESESEVFTEERVYAGVDGRVAVA